MNKETLKDAAEKYSKRHQDVSGTLGKYLVSAVFQDGANWQCERMYSEEEVDLLVNELINQFTNWSGSYVYRDKLIEIYEQLKKK
jgi:hypothetical protein